MSTFTPRFLVVSLGNPGPYLETFHSVGHFASDHAQRLLKSAQPRRTMQKLGGPLCLASVSSPYTFVESPTLMNVSGPFVAKLWKYMLETHQLKPSELSLVLVHDELEQEFGVVKLRKWKASHRGHNGVKSVQASLKASAYPGARWSRIAVGIDRPEARDHKSVSDYVLQKMKSYHRDILRERSALGVLGCLRELQDEWEEDYDEANPGPNP